MALALCAAPLGRAQDAATEEQLQKLRGRIEDLTTGQDALSKRLDDLGRQVESLRQEQGRPLPNYAGLDDLKRLAKAIEEDRGRIDNLEKIRTELKQITDALRHPPTVREERPRPNGTSTSPKKRNPQPPDNPSAGIREAGPRPVSSTR